MALQHVRTTPVLRSFDEVKAREFYVDFLGFTVDWEHRFAPDMPLFMQVSRAGIVLWLSEHHGDGSPGANVTIEVSGLRAFHAELTGRTYRNARPGIGPFIGGGLEVDVRDPAGNRLAFVERDVAAPPTPGSVLDGITPFFIVADAARTLGFYRDGLGFEVTFVAGDDAPFFAVVRRGRAELMLKAVGAGVVARPNPTRHVRARWDAFVATADPDALAAELAGRGVACVVPAENTEDGLLGFEVRDPDGHVLYFGRPA
jgi:catechol 2,3-dioxygenase-like lactoylglutathione lyase family enzyme